MLANQTIREKCKSKGVRFWELAKYMGVSECTFTKRMREDVSPDMQDKIFAAIEDIASKRQPEREGW